MAPSGLHARLCHAFLVFLMISWRQIIWRSAGSIFAIFTSNESFLIVDDRSGPVFSISQGTMPWQLILCKNWHTLHFRRSGIQKRYEVTACVGRILSATNATMLCKNLVKIRPVVSAEKRLIEIALHVLTLLFDVFRWISPDILDWFSQSFHRMKALYMPMMEQY